MLRTGILLSLCLTSLALECFVRKHTDPCATTQECNEGEVCEIVKQAGATTQGCRPKDRCGVAGGFCCTEDECNIDEPSNSTNSTDEGVTCLIGTMTSNIAHTYSGTCQSDCRREKIFDGNGNLTLLFGCGYDGNCKKNQCFITFNGNEICCCDSDNCNSNTTPKNKITMPQVKTFEREVPLAKCYTNTAEGTKLTDCKANEVCMRKEHVGFGCVEKESEFCKEGHCCLGKECNKEEVPLEVTCTTAVYEKDGSSIIHPNKAICQFGCTRILLEDTITFSCAGNECIGKKDGCYGDRCCCFENDCANPDRYALPDGFEDVRKKLVEPSAAPSVSTSILFLAVLLIKLY